MAADPVAYFLTWSTYGTWLPGDERGWVAKGGGGVQPPDPEKRRQARDAMTEEELWLTDPQRELVHATIEAHCRFRGWTLHARNARTNHVHVVVTSDIGIDETMEQLKAWCTRRLKEAAAAAAPGEWVRQKWWAEDGSRRFVFDEPGLTEVGDYVMTRQ